MGFNRDSLTFLGDVLVSGIQKRYFIWNGRTRFRVDKKVCVYDNVKEMSVGNKLYKG